jgi:hypothetical protein
MSDGEQVYDSEHSSFGGSDDSESDDASSVDEEISDLDEPAAKKVRKSTLPVSKQKRVNTTKSTRVSNKAKPSLQNTEKPLKNTKKSSRRPKTTTVKTMNPAEKRKVAELQVVEPLSKRHRLIERQVRLRMAAATAEEQDETFDQEAVEKTVYLQKSRSEAYQVTKLDLKTMRQFVWDKGLVGPSQPELLQDLLVEIGAEEQDEVAIREKLKQKVRNVNRTRREFDEMVAEDDIDDVKNRIVKAFKSFGSRPGALPKVKEALAELEDFAGTLG